MLAWLLIPIGVVIIIYAEKIGTFTGAIGFAEKIFGPGGTYAFVKIFGLLVSIFSIMWATGGLQIFLRSTVGGLFGFPV